MTYRQREDWVFRAYLQCERSEIVKAAVAYLEQWPWEWFGTTTFKPPRHVERNTLAFCKRHSDRLFREISTWLHGKRWRSRGTGVYGWRVWHRHRSGVWHCHWLLAGTNDRPHFLKELHEFCKEDPVLGYQWVERVTPERIRYVADYMSGGAELWEPFGIRWFHGPRDDGRVPDLVHELVRECGRHARCSANKEVK